MCSKLSTHHLVDGAIKGIILGKDEQYNEGHVDMMRISVLHVVKDLEDGQHLRGRQEERETEAEHVLRRLSFNPCCNISDSFPPLHCVQTSKREISQVHARRIKSVAFLSGAQLYSCSKHHQLHS